MYVLFNQLPLLLVEWRKILRTSSVAAITLNLSLKGDLLEAAANLFNMLHQLDKPAFSNIAVMSVPNEGIGVAINDRLNRAAIK